MLGRIFKSSLMLAVLILAAADIAQAKTIGSDHAALNAASAQALQQYFGSVPLNDASSPPEDSRTITLNFGPLHFHEVIKHAPKSCPA